MQQASTVCFTAEGHLTSRRDTDIITGLQLIMLTIEPQAGLSSHKIQCLLCLLMGMERQARISTTGPGNYLILLVIIDRTCQNIHYHSGEQPTLTFIIGDPVRYW
nr:hypothetical protein KV8917_350076 [Klebsiella variicola]